MNDTQRKGTRKIEARQSQIGVIGDHAHIEGGIHFHDATPPPSPPFMVESLQDFVDRPGEFERLIAHLLDRDRDTPAYDEPRRIVAITAALRGAGGYGKTMLARAICHDDRIRRAFLDGILWVTLGQTPDVLGGLRKLYAALTGQRPAFVDVEDAANALAAQLDGRECLMVVDDVWHPVHLRPFLRGGERCARLITTRDGATLPGNARTVDVDAMRQNEAVALLGAGLPPADASALRVLAARLGEWPLLLKLVNGQLRRRVHDYGQPLPAALTDVHAALDRRGLTAFDARDTIERDQAVAKTVGLSLDMLDPEERDRYGELAIFPEDAAVPLAVLEKLWDLDEFETKELCGRFWRLSLLLHFDLAEGTIRLHDVMRACLMREYVTQLPTYHVRFLDAYAEDVDDWTALPPEEHYLWRHLAYHLRQAGRGDELCALLFDFDWLQAKLDATDVNALLADYEFSVEEGPGGEGLSRVQSAIRFSAHVLLQDKTQLAGQLLARLAHLPQPELRPLFGGAARWQGAPWLRPLTPTLTPPGGPLLRTLTGHTAWVSAVAVTPDGRRAVSASEDWTLKVCDLGSGEELVTLTGHSGPVWAVTVTPDGRRAVSGSSDKTLKVWDLESGEELATLTGHSEPVRAVAVTPDGQRAVSGSWDNTLKVWDLESGEELATLTGHSRAVWAVAVTANGRRAVSGSWDNTLKVWDISAGLNTSLESEEELAILTGHSRNVSAVAVTADGRRAVSASDD
jgi:WD40 repeat protein